ncbi:putative s-adenosylmethionine-dependent methyltransferase, partial [Quercus suber]
RGAIAAAKALINEAIAEKLDIKNFSSSNTFRVTDLGCSIGPNTFLAVQNIIDAVELKYQSQGHNAPEFQVLDKSSPAWNKGRIHYSNASPKVFESYAAQYAKDIECFLNARAQEVVCGGLMAIIVPCRPNGLPCSQDTIIDTLGSCLLDMAKKGIFSEEKVDIFNLPLYFASPQELEAAVERNGCFRLEKMEILPQEKPSGNFSRGKVLSSQVRAGMEGLFKNHFGEEIIDEFFDSVHKKLNELSKFESGNGGSLFILLKRIATI